MRVRIYKTLTRNDTGETHSHQSGITIPSKVASSGIFPELGILKLNPRKEITFYDEEKKPWTFQYIYYNDIYFGKEKQKAHNEHRLTCVTAYIKENNIMSGDSIWFEIDDNGVRRIGFEKQAEEIEKPQDFIIKLGSGWRSVRM